MAWIRRMSGPQTLKVIVDDACFPGAMRAALRAAETLPPYEIRRDCSTSFARTKDTTDRITLVWRSARIEFNSLGVEPTPDISKRDAAAIAASILRTGLVDETDDAMLDELMGDLERTALALALDTAEGCALVGMTYAQTRTPFTGAHSMRSVRKGSDQHVETGGDEAVTETMRRGAVVFVTQARMEDDVAIIVLQAPGAVADPEKLDAMDRLRLAAWLAERRKS
jgi:hypothetical protein